jgi:dihydroorotase
MRKLSLLFFSILLLAGSYVQAQNQRAAPPQKPYAIIIKGGHVIDPKNNIDAVMDIAITAGRPAQSARPAIPERPAENGQPARPAQPAQAAMPAVDGKIALIAKNIDPSLGVQVVNAEGLYVTPGLIDIHSHNFPGVRPGDPDPDGFTLRNGTTTTVDAGSSGWKTFARFKKETIDRSETRVLSWLNIVGNGFAANEQDTTDMDSKLSADFARQNKDYIVGFKVAHYSSHSWTPVDRAVEAGRQAGGLPIMVDFGSATPALSIEELFFKHFRPGDIFTHCFAELGKSRESIVDPQTKKIKPFVVEAQKRGIVFDVGYGGISFAFSQAIPAVKSGFYPNSMGTDMNHSALNSSMKNILDVMSKFMAIGMDLQSVIRAATWNPAKEIKREELGNLSLGAPADIAILGIREGKFGLYDYTGYKIDATKKLECEMTIRGGRIVYDLNGRADPIVVGSRRQN